MKTLPTLLICATLSYAQNAFSDKKIDMHGGKYNSLTGYKTSNFGNSNMNTLLFRDKNTTKPQGLKKKI